AAAAVARGGAGGGRLGGGSGAGRRRARPPGSGPGQAVAGVAQRHRGDRAGRPDLRGGSRAAGRGGRDGQVSLSPRPGGAARRARRATKRTRHNGSSPRSLGNIMMSSLPGQAGPPAGADGHAGEDLLAGYATGTVDGVAVWSVEAHLTRCARCRAALSAHVDAERLAGNRSVLLVRAALPEGGWVRRLLCRCGVPDHLLRLLVATPSLRRSWLLSVAGVLAVVAGEAAAVTHGWLGTGGHMVPPGYLDPGVLAPFLLVAPLLVLAGGAAAVLPGFFTPSPPAGVAAFVRGPLPSGPAHFAPR